jgi:hypothetical protein
VTKVFKALYESEYRKNRSAVGALGKVGADSAAFGRASLDERQAEVGGSLCRCRVCSGEKGGLAVGPTRRGKGTKILAIAADNSLPLAVSVQSASPHESQLVDEVLAGSFLDELPARLIGDRAYDSDTLDQRLKAEYDIELIAPLVGNERCERRMDESYGVTTDGGAWNDFLLGFTGSADSSPATSTTSRTFSAWYDSRA